MGPEPRGSATARSSLARLDPRMSQLPPTAKDDNSFSGAAAGGAAAADTWLATQTPTIASLPGVRPAAKGKPLPLQ